MCVCVCVCVFHPVIAHKGLTERMLFTTFCSQSLSPPLNGQISKQSSSSSFLLLFSFSFLSTSLSLVVKSGRLTAAARAALPIPIGVCSIITCPNNDMGWVPVLGMSNVRTDVDACDCTQGL